MSDNFANRNKLKEILKQVREGVLDVDTAIEEIRDPGFEDIGFARLDHDRGRRRGFPEVVLCEGKTTEQVVKIVAKMSEKHDNILASRAQPEVFAEVKEVVPAARYNELGQMIVIERNKLPRAGLIKVICAGTSDLPVMEEAVETARIMGNKVETIVDAGVAGVHRLLEDADTLNQARVLIVVAGMEGALPSVVGGLVRRPVIAVPTSVGYGANFEGLAPLLTMLNSCAAGIGVVNIDNGFGAAYLANLINKTGETD
ncbi:MAG: nickel pincer cofactor biosynthesis protein LarB [Halanaerobiales bacterium]